MDVLHGVVQLVGGDVFDGGDAEALVHHVVGAAVVDAAPADQGGDGLA